MGEDLLRLRASTFSIIAGTDRLMRPASTHASGDDADRLQCADPGSATMYAAMMASTIAAVRNTPATAIHVMRLETFIDGAVRGAAGVE